MITRHYFIKIQSKPPLTEKRIINGEVTVATCIVSHCSLFPKPKLCWLKAIRLVESEKLNFYIDEFIITSMVRL